MRFSIETKSQLTQPVVLILTCPWIAQSAKQCSSVPKRIHMLLQQPATPHSIIFIVPFIHLNFNVHSAAASMRFQISSAICSGVSLLPNAALKSVAALSARMFSSISIFGKTSSMTCSSMVFSTT